MRQRNHRQPGEFNEVAGRFSRLYGGEILGIGARGERKQDNAEAYPHPVFQAGSHPLQHTDSQEAKKLQKAFSGYLDWTAANNDEQECLYPFGVADGLYLARQIERIIHSVTWV